MSRSKKMISIIGNSRTIAIDDRKIGSDGWIVRGRKIVKISCQERRFVMGFGIYTKHHKILHNPAFNEILEIQKNFQYHKLCMDILKS